MPQRVYKPFIAPVIFCDRDLPDDSQSSFGRAQFVDAHLASWRFEGRAAPSITFLGIGHPKLAFSSAANIPKAGKAALVGAGGRWHWP